MNLLAPSVVLSTPQYYFLFPIYLFSRSSFVSLFPCFPVSCFPVFLYSCISILNFTKFECLRPNLPRCSAQRVLKSKEKLLLCLRTQTNPTPLGMFSEIFLQLLNFLFLFQKSDQSNTARNLFQNFPATLKLSFYIL